MSDLTVTLVTGQTYTVGAISTAAPYTVEVPSTGAFDVSASGVGPQGIQGATGSTGVQGTTGIQGAAGSQGTSGSSGTQGTTGSSGSNGVQGASGSNGVQGTEGLQGAQGTFGIRGSEWFTGSDNPLSTIPGIQDKDFYFKYSDNTVWQYAAGIATWYLLSNITGAQGTQGVQGIRGDRYAATSSTVFTHSDYHVGGPILTIVLNNLPFSYTQGQSVLVNYVDDINIWLRGMVWGYNAFSGQLSIQITDTSAPYGNPLGSWNVNLEGNSGAQGIQGAAGSNGTSGTQGTQGSVGSNGSQGIQGIQGITGAGTQGAQGTVGSSGTQGAQGQQGITGAGTQGSQGIQGIQGRQGIQGTLGSGTQGTQGTQGEQGIQGIQGTLGSGTQGTQGTQGQQGIQGIQGIQGRQGIQGISGNGTQGTQGAQGTVGTQGAQGTQGTQGSLGGQGIQGIQGITGGLTGSITFTEGTSIPSAANIDDYSLDAAAFYKITGTTASNVNGFANGSSGRFIIIANNSNKNQTFAQEATSSAASNRFVLGVANKTIGVNQTATFIYLTGLTVGGAGSQSRWVLTSTT